MNDEKLSKLLKSWQNMEPTPAFESNVWRRIRQLPVEQQDRFSLRRFLPEWPNMRPAYAAAAALIGIVAGLTCAMAIPAPSQNLHNNLFKPLPERSLSASYVQLVGGEKL